MQPGQTVTPGQQPADTEKAEPTPEVPAVPAEQPQQAAPEVRPDEIEQPFAAPVPEASEGQDTVRWTASEYVDHAKGPAWFAVMGLGLFAIVALVYFLLKDILAAVLLGLAGITFGVFAGRRPQVLEYTIDEKGLHIGQRLHSFDDFKSFSLTQAGALPAILLMPLKRFLPPITIFYDPKEEDKIVDAIANYLPHEDREPDMVDKLMGRIRF